MIRLFVGCSTGEDLESLAVLEYTARSLSSLPIDITWMHQGPTGPWSGWNARSWRTPFTGFRWGIPAVCGYEGRAIYCDSDFIFLADLAEVWSQPIPEVALVKNPKGKLSTSFILFDCAKAKAHIPSLDTLRQMPDAHGTMLNYFRGQPHLVSATEGNWDCADLAGYRLEDPTVKAIHYTRMETQPHLKYAIPRLRKDGRSHWYPGDVFPHPRPELQQLFDDLYEKAIAEGFTLDRYDQTYVEYQKRAFQYTTHKTAQ